MATGAKKNSLKWKTLGLAYDFISQESSAITIPSNFNELLVNIYVGNVFFGKMIFVPEEFTSSLKTYRVNGYYESSAYMADTVVFIKKGKLWGIVRVNGSMSSSAKCDIYYR